MVPWAGIGELILLVDSCPFVLGDLTSFSEVLSNLLLCFLFLVSFWCLSPFGSSVSLTPSNLHFAQRKAPTLAESFTRYSPPVMEVHYWLLCYPHYRLSVQKLHRSVQEYRSLSVHMSWITFSILHHSKYCFLKMNKRFISMKENKSPIHRYKTKQSSAVLWKERTQRWGTHESESYWSLPAI